MALLALLAAPPAPTPAAAGAKTSGGPVTSASAKGALPTDARAEAADCLRVLCDGDEVLQAVLAEEGALPSAAMMLGAGGDVATARFLHARGVDFGAPNHVGHTPLNKAAAKGHADLVEWILQHVDYDNVLLRDQTGRTAADAAADANFPHLAGFLHERIALAEGRRRLSTAPRWLRPRRRAAT